MHQYINKFRFQAILEQAANIPEHMPIKINCAKFANIKKRDAQELIKYRARKRARILINYAAEKTADDTASSDDSFDEDGELPKIPIKHDIDGESIHFSPDFVGKFSSIQKPKIYVDYFRL